VADSLLYTHPEDNIAGRVVPTLTTGTVASGYQIAYLYDSDPSNPFKTVGTTFRLVWDFGVATLVKGVALIHHNFVAGLSGVFFQMHTANVWTSPAFSHVLVPPAYLLDQFPVNVFGDFRTLLPTYRYASLAVTVANVVSCSIGEFLILSELRSIDGFTMSSSDDQEDHPIVEHKTDVGVSTIFLHGTRLRWFRGNVLQGKTTADNIRNWGRATYGRGLPFLIVPLTYSDAEPWLVRWEDGKINRHYHESKGYSTYSLAFEEISRGLKPTPSAV